MNKILFLLFILLLGCDDIITESTSERYELYLYMKTEMDDGVYLIDYPNNQPHSYTSVYYQITPPSTQRVFWASLDSFTIIHQGFTITEPIINYSTYSRDDGTGKQHIYLNRTMINKRLSIIGCVSEDECEVIEFDVY